MESSCTPPATSASKTERTDDRRTDRRHHPAHRVLHLRLRPVAVPRRRRGGRHPDGPRVRRRRRPRSAPTSETSESATSSSARSSRPTTPARSAGPATRSAASTPAGPATAPRPSTPASRSPTAPSSPHPGSLTPTSSRRCSPHPTCSAPVGSPPSPPRPVPARRSPSSVTARSACSAILAAKQLGAERIIAMSRHADRQALAREFGATDIVEERGDAGVAKIKELTDGLGAHCVIEAVGTQESMMQAIRATRAGGHVGYVGVSHDVDARPASNCSSPACTCTAARRPCAASCPSSSS